jgi:hypothetical protein
LLERKDLDHLHTLKEERREGRDAVNVSKREAKIIYLPEGARDVKELSNGWVHVQPR